MTWEGIGGLTAPVWGVVGAGREDARSGARGSGLVTARGRKSLGSPWAERGRAGSAGSPLRVPRRRPWGLPELGSAFRLTELTACDPRRAWTAPPAFSDPSASL